MGARSKIRRRCCLFFSLLVVLGLGCSGLDRSNPLDPKNPETRGKVSGVEVSSQKHDVSLSWDSIASDGIKHYSVYRKEADETEFKLIGNSDGNRARYQDLNRAYDQSSQYCISASTTAGYESPRSDPVTITPGPLSYWVLDYYDGSIHHLTYDGRHRLSLIREAIWPTAAVADTARQRIWVIDYVTGFLLKISDRGDILEWISGLDHPTAITLDPVSHELWIVNRRRSEVVRLDSTGKQISYYTAFQEIRQLVWSGTEGFVWVADFGKKQAGLLDRKGDWTVVQTLTSQKSPVLDCQFSTGLTWLADSTTVMLVSSRPAAIPRAKQIVLSEPVEGLSVNQKTGGCWAILGQENLTEKKIVRIDKNGSVSNLISGFERAHALAANPHHGGCIVADSDNNRVVMLDSTGVVFSERFGFVSPYDVINY